MAGLVQARLFLLRNTNWQTFLYPKWGHLAPSTFTRNVCDTVPPSKPATKGEIDELTKFVSDSKKLLVLTGAGISTESELPDYSSEGSRFQHLEETNTNPSHAKFEDKEVQKKFWFSHYSIWNKYGNKKPNTAHKVLKQWEDADKVHWLVTLNVDEFHKMVGSQNVTELHGSARRVICQSCNTSISRDKMQELITKRNPGIDFENEEKATTLTVPESACKGVYKPAFVMRGGTIPECTKQEALDKLNESDAMLIIGTSLKHSNAANKLVENAIEAEKPIAIINITETKWDGKAKTKVSDRCGHVLERVNQKLNDPK